jgi:hypothetical protein
MMATISPTPFVLSALIICGSRIPSDLKLLHTTVPLKEV